MKDATFLHKIAATSQSTGPLSFNNPRTVQRLYRLAKEPAPLDVPLTLPIETVRELLKKGLFHQKQLSLPGVL